MTKLERPPEITYELDPSLTPFVDHADELANPLLILIAVEEFEDLTYYGED